uniref:Uncharacterized protein n=1 Tax=Oryctolagus cuniculus TaxID=9986 RepID=A0A5F9DGH5_RABIT
MKISVFAVTAICPLHTPLYYANQPFGKFRQSFLHEMKSFLALQSLIKGVILACTVENTATSWISKSRVANAL